MTKLFDRLPLALRARASRGSTTRRSGDRQTPLGSRSGGSLSRGYWNGLTLIEMLVALAVTLVMMAAVVNLFANISGSIRNRRAAIETGAQLRQVRQRLAMDLNGATCRGTTWQRPEANQGYIEIIEGRWSDKNPSELIDGNTGNGELDYLVSNIPSSQGFDSDTGLASDGRPALPVGAITDGRALGDWDDILALTVRSESDPFVVQEGGVMVESPLAEVVWFATENPLAGPGEPGMRKVYRRVLLIAPWLGPWGSRPDNISAHQDAGTGQWIANTLADCTKRENRASNRPNNPATDFPHAFGAIAGGTNSLVLDNALGFDLRVYDPGAPLFAYAPRSRAVLPNDTIVEPSDFGWNAAVQEDAARSSPAGPTGYGAYCDLGWAIRPNATNIEYPTGATIAQPLGPGPWPTIVPAPVFHMPHRAGWHPNPSTPAAFVDFPAVYDTWSYHYENDGINQDAGATETWRNATVDQGANGLDDDGANGVDDRGERETSPPYDVPLRGIKVILRVYEPDARQIRESSVTHSFRQ